jgi:hypothetical protein
MEHEDPLFRRCPMGLASAAGDPGLEISAALTSGAAAEPFGRARNAIPFML